MKTRSLNNKRASILLLCALVASYSFICLTKNCFSSAMVFIVDEGLLTKFQTGLITATFYVIYAILQIAGGVVTDKWHPERFITFGLLGAAACNLVIYFNQNYIVMLVAWGVNAAVQFGVWPATFKLVSTMLTEDMRDNSLFIVTFSNPVGVVASYLVSALVSERWQLNFLLSAIGLCVIAVAWELVFRAVKPYIVETELAAQKSGGATLGKGEFLKLAISSGIIMIIAISFIRCMFDLGIKALAPSLIFESYEDVSATLATVLNVVVLIAGASGPVLAHIIYPRYIRNEAVALTIFFGISLPLVALLLIFIGKVHYSVVVVLLALIVMLIGGGSLFTTSFVAARFNKWGKGATIAGILNCFSSLGVVVANVAFTAIADGVGWICTITVWFIMMSVALILSLITAPVWGKFLKNR